MFFTENNFIKEDDASFDEPEIHNVDKNDIMPSSLNEINDIIEDLKSDYEAKNAPFNDELQLNISNKQNTEAYLN